MSYLFLLGGVFCCVAIISQLVSSLVVILRQNRRDIFCADGDIGVSILRPVCGVENYIEETLRSTFQLDYPRYEVIFCAAKPDDPVIPIVQRLIETYPDVEARLLIGNTLVSANPKLNNLVKGWNDARYDWILMADSNVQMPADHVQRMLSAWREDTGLVCSPPIGGEPQNVWAELECAFLNTYQGRWQCFADSLGFGFAQGKAMLWQRELLNLAGGIEALGNELAEDAAATKAVRALGLRVRLVAQPFKQPLGSRSLAEVWRRQVRWARLRRTTFKFFFVPELLAGFTPPFVAAMMMALAAGYSMVDVAIPLIIGWYAVEALLAYRAGWHLSHRSILIWMLRDALLPALWISAWAGDDFEWRGNSMSVAIEASH